ncbi:MULTISPECIES: hypothetical protein [Microbacterium]|jgi:hypothetical protein|uniref:DUF7882 family protein n=1 Tax=Microbacterium TaxID=33882 RepID=UPI000F5DE4C8|nr:MULTISPECIES: hypothetical protein [Microbacterium]AZH79663.1 hypothetical protein CSX12_15035 [Microbacterium sp. Y-01]
MGKLEYNSSRPAIEVDDETLVHLKIVMGTKLRRHESFMMTWPAAQGRAGRMTAWMHPSIPLILEFDSEDLPKVDSHRIERMMTALNARGELVLDDLP